jgi:hypothetical protein
MRKKAYACYWIRLLTAEESFHHLWDGLVWGRAFLPVQAERSSAPHRDIVAEHVVFGVKQKAGVLVVLFLLQAAMAGDTQPFAILKYPGIGKAPEVLVRLAAVCAFRMIIPGHDGSG